MLLPVLKLLLVRVHILVDVHTGEPQYARQVPDTNYALITSL